MKKPLLFALALAGCPTGEVGPLLGIDIASPTGPVFTNGAVELTLTVSGGPDKVVVLRGGEEVATVASPFTTVSLDTTSWPEGQHSVVVRASLKTANVDSAALEVTVDRTAPRVVRRWLDGPSWWGDGFGVEVDEPVTVANAAVLTVQAMPAPGQLSADGLKYSATVAPTYTALPFNGQAAIVAGSLTDRAGNVNAAMSWSFELTKWSKTAALAGSNARVAVGPNGVAWLAFTERIAQADRIAVARVSEGRVQTLTSPGAGSWPAVAVDAMGRPVVAWQTDTDVVAARFESGAWVTLGTTVGAGGFPDVALDVAGNPVVAFTDLGGPMRMGPRTVRVSKWAGTAWTAAAPDLTTAGVAGLADPSGPALAMEGDTPVVAHLEVVLGVTQLKVGATSLNVRALSSARAQRLAARGAQVVIAWEEDDDVASTIHVAQRVNGVWSRLGRPLDVDLARPAKSPVLGIDATGAPVVAWAEESHWGRWTLPISRYTNGAWSFLGGEELAGGQRPYPGGLAVQGESPLVAAHGRDGVSLYRFNAAGLANPFGIAARAAASTCSLGLDTGGPPTSLAATNCFDTTQNPPRAAADLVPYDLSSPLWSDAALKRRWLRLPAGQTLGYSGRGALSFPEGTMVVKEFSYVATPGDGTTRRPVETRFLVKTASGWEGFGYEWNATFTDATLLDEPGTKRVTWPYVGVDGGHVQIYPTRDQCNTCHVAASGHILGVVAGQLNRTHDYGGVYDSQLRVFEHLGLFGATSTADAGRFANPHDTTESLYRRVRAYLASNCAQCHQPGGSRPTRDFRWETSLADSHICDAGAPFGPEITPGEPMNSLLPAKMQGLGAGARMPPLASDVVDFTAVSLVEEWIGSITQCAE
ncbi:MAG: hypothetical protein JNK82_04875 [Myxococcaceae bacterium]|nr:hypothetical protein [Myxococcaceae bacterium]